MPKMHKKEWMVAKSVADLLMCSLQRETENLQDPWKQEIRDGDQADDEADREVGIVADAVEVDPTRAIVDDKKDELDHVQSRAEKCEDVRVQTRVEKKSREKEDDHDRDLEVADQKENRLIQRLVRRLAQSLVCDRNHQLNKKPSDRAHALLQKDESAPVRDLDRQVWKKRERRKYHRLDPVLDLDRTHDRSVYKTAIYQKKDESPS